MSRFLWGAATSSYQVEGGISGNDWDYYTRSDAIRTRIYGLTSRNILYGNDQFHIQPAGDALRGWNPEYYMQDFDNARELGLNAMRISLEWSRIEPQKGQW